MTKWIVDTNELDNVRYQLKGCANALDIMGDAMQDYEGQGVGFIAYSMKQLAGRLAKLVEEAEEINVKEAGGKNG